MNEVYLRGKLVSVYELEVSANQLSEPASYGKWRCNRSNRNDRHARGRKAKGRCPISTVTRRALQIKEHGTCHLSKTADEN